ncbi:GNAT family N-acetyltransferase [archaeon]|nr:MAG: GNAT family N-acetyltransferase [archaeon]
MAFYTVDCSHPGLLDHTSFRTQLAQLAQLSALAQDLKVPITSYDKLLSSDVVDQVLLVYVDITEMTGMPMGMALIKKYYFVIYARYCAI